MKVLYFVQYFIPEKCSSPYLVTDLIEAMAQQGWKVDVYTSTPTRGVDRDTIRYYRRHRVETMFSDNVHIHRMPLFQEKTKVIQRTLRFLLFSLECLWIGLTKDADVVFCGSGPPTQGVILGLIHKLTHKKVVYNLQDAFPESLVTTGITSEGSAVYNVGLKMERFTYNNVDRIITISESMFGNMISKVDNPDKVSMVYNWLDDTVHHVERQDNDLFERFDLSRDRFIVTYAGNVGKAQGIETLIDAADILKSDSDIEFCIFGAGASLENIKAYAAGKGLDNVRFLPLLGKDDISKVYSLGDVSLVMCRKGVGTSGMPSKTWSIIAAQTALIVSFDAGSELYNMVSSGNCGIAVDAERPAELADAILKMKSDKAVKESCIANAYRVMLDKASRKSSVGKYIDQIKSCIKDN